MLFAREINLAKILKLSQWDKIILTLVFAFGLPFLAHALPFGQAFNIGAKWLPIFYAPLIAVLIFRPHVSLVAALFAPLINHAIFGMPNGNMVLVLTFELFVFSSVLILFKEKRAVSGAVVVLAYVFTRLLALLALGNFTFSQLGQYWLNSIMFALPGIAMLFLLAATINRLNKGLAK